MKELRTRATAGFSQSPSIPYLISGSVGDCLAPSISSRLSRWELGLLSRPAKTLGTSSTCLSRLSRGNPILVEHSEESGDDDDDIPEVDDGEVNYKDPPRVALVYDVPHLSVL